MIALFCRHVRTHLICFTLIKFDGSDNININSIHKKRSTKNIKKLYKKELPSRPVGQSFQGLDVLSLSQLKMAGTTADEKWQESQLSTFCSRLHSVTNINS